MPRKHVPEGIPVATGQVIAGRYAVSGVIGQGGMGVVLAGRHLELGERVAIKFLHRENASHADRFFREARAAARIRSEHVVRIYDVGRLPSGEPYIVMEHLEGEDLDARVDRLGKLDVQFVADVLLEVCQALAEAHAAGIVHRDLKPANIFLAKSPGRDDLVKLLDFGVAKVPDGGAITKTASVLGSPIYMSPEQLMATRDVDARSDIWSLGIILYELLTGEYPFEGDSLVHLAMVIREKDTPRARDLRPELPEGIDTVISRCLEKNRNDRYKDVGEFAEALADYASPAISLSISRIKRIVQEKKERLALASTESTEEAASAETLAEEDGEKPDTGGGNDNLDEADLKSTAQVDSYKDEMAEPGRSQSSSSGDRARETPAASGTSPLAASLAAVSSSTSLAAAEEKRRRQRYARLALGAVALAGLAIAGRSLLLVRDRPVETRPASLVAEAAADLPPSVPLSRDPIRPPPPAPVGSAASVPSVAVVAPAPTPVVRSTKPIPPKPPASAAATPSVAPPPPTESCDPPYTIDEAGIKRLKKHCK